LVKQQKKEMRKKINSYNKKIRDTDFTKMDTEIINKVFNTVQYKKCKMILIYYPMRNEVNTITLINQAIKDNKIVALPKILEGKMHFIKLDNDWINNLSINKYKIAEPESNEYIIEFRDCLMIIPNLALAKDNTRLGHGMGYYDIFLKGKKDIYKMGICRKHLLFESLPTEENDELLDIVISSI
jgi:5-formyltetrahydrofolate cyclo-ligase